MNVLPAPTGHCVHIWYAACPDHQDVDALSPLERARAVALTHPGARAQFVAGRVVGRAVLAAYLGMPPAQVPIEVAPNGKPFLGRSTYHFNLSHSGDRIAVAVAAQPVGLDIEQIDARLGTADLAARFFADEEVAALHGHQPSSASWPSAFFGCWSRKEAVVKALGDGLTLPLRSFAVTVPPEAPRLRRGDAERLSPSSWSIADLQLGEGYAGAVAIRAGAIVVEQRQWPPASLEVSVQ